jgi:hypothetical protein
MSYMCLTPNYSIASKVISNIVENVSDCPSNGYIAYSVSDTMTPSDTVQVSWMVVSVLLIAFSFKAMKRSVT